MLSREIANMLVVLLVTALSSAGCATGEPSGKALRPIIFTPGAAGSILEVNVTSQTFAPDCPPSASYQIYMFGSTEPLVAPLCAHKYLRLSINTTASPPKVNNLPGVTTRIPHEGTPDCMAPFYQKTFMPEVLRAGYKPGANFHVVCWDTRLTPDLVAPHNGLSWMDITVPLIEKAYRENNNTAVLLVGYSNGVYYNKYLVDQMPQAWLDKYIAGFVSLHGNLVGFYFQAGALIKGADISIGMPLPGAEEALQTWPNIYASLPDPVVFKDKFVVWDAATNRGYKATQYDELFRDLNLTTALHLHHHFVGKYGTSTFPRTNVYALLANYPTSTPGLQRITRSPVALPTVMVTGDHTVSKESNDVFFMWKDQHNSTCDIQVKDLAWDLPVPSNHVLILSVPYLVENFIGNIFKGWDVTAGCASAARPGPRVVAASAPASVPLRRWWQQGP